MLKHERHSVDHTRCIIMFRYKIQREVSRCKSTENKKEHLDHIRVSNHFHSAQRNDDRENGKTTHTHPKINSGDCRYCKRAKEKNRCKVYNNVKQQPEHCHDCAYRFIVTLP